MPTTIRALAASALLAAFPVVGPAAEEGGTRVVIRAAEAGVPRAFPAVAELEPNITPGSCRLVDEEGEINADLFQCDHKFYIAFALPGRALAPAERRTFRLRPGRDEDRRSAVELQRDGANLRVLFDGALFTELRVDLGNKPILYPVIGPGGLAATRAYPMKDVEGEDKDHPHQRSFWFTHGNVNGLDFWASDPLNKPSPKSGTIRETDRQVIADGEVIAVVRTSNDWLGPDGKAVCEDVRTFRFFNAGAGNPRVVDLDITIKATAGPVTFGDTKEGMFGLRVPSSMDSKRGQGGHIVNAEGLTDTATWGKASPWVDYSGPVGDGRLGILILNHPESFRYPTTWHVRDYGLFAANPFGWTDFGRKESGAYTIPKGESISFRYRVVLHGADGPFPSAEWFSAFEHPPTVELKGD